MNAWQEKDHDIKRDAKGEMFVQGVTLVQVDPNDAGTSHFTFHITGWDRLVDRLLA
jgi:hypothetical protein